jgi:hypothetical protein
MQLPKFCATCIERMSILRLAWLTGHVASADAILGALSEPDIGQLFPDSDPKWKGQTSDVFVKEAVSVKAGLFLAASACRMLLGCIIAHYSHVNAAIALSVS